MLPLSIARFFTRFNRRSRTWEGLYRAGEPERYKKLDQRARYSVIEGYCRSIGKGLRILDVGCGAGILPSRLDRTVVGEYVGIDVSPTAIAEARQTCPTWRFECTPVENFRIRENDFDVVIFNESLYCLQQPWICLRRFLSLVSPGGAIIVSVTGLHPEFQEALDAEMSGLIGSCTSLHDRASDKSWKVYLINPHPGYDKPL